MFFSLVGLPADVWANLGGAPFVTVSPRALKFGSARTPNNGADYGPDNDTTGTNGLQDALNAISGGGLVYVYGEGAGNPYTLTQALHNTGSSQVVWFEPNAYLVNAITQGSAGDGASMIYIFSNASYKSGGPEVQPTTAYQNCYWYGNGATINGENLATNYAIQVNVTGPLNGGTVVAYECEFGGFNLINIAGGALLCATINGHGSSPTDLQSCHNIRFFQITATFSSSTNATNAGIPVGVNSCNRIVFEDLDIDCSGLPSVDYSNPFIWSAQGLCHDIRFQRCHFKGNGTNGQVPEVQGSGVSGGAPSSSVTGKIVFEDCIFDSGSSSVQLAGSGGGFLDDNNSASENAYLTDIEFVRCYWINCGISLQSNSSVSPTPYGYVRFRDCRNMPGKFSGYLPGRWPIDSPTNNPATTISVGTSPFTYPAGKNPSSGDPFSETIIISGGTVSQIAFDGIVTGLTNGVFRLFPGDYISVTYSSAPSMYKIAE
jgi:hypothetical protein